VFCQLRATQQQKLEDKLRAQGLPTDGWEAVVFSSPYDRKRRTGYIHNELAPPGEFILREMSEVIARTRRAQEGQQ
jgi:predicted alpha/beta-hydrolase family hydrolase